MRQGALEVLRLDVVHHVLSAAGVRENPANGAEIARGEVVLDRVAKQVLAGQL